MLREDETVYRSELSDLTDEFADLLDGLPEFETALARSLRRCRQHDAPDGDGTGGTSDFGSAIG